MRMTTARLVLRDFEIDDWLAVLAYRRDPLYGRFYPESWAEPTDEQVREFVQQQINDQHAEPRRRFQLAILLPATGELIGNCGIRRKPQNDWEADIGYELNPRHWGHGYATEAARAMVHFGFRELGLHRVSSWCISDNIASAHVLEKCGLRQEGRFRENEYFRNRWWDTLLYGLLEDEWSPPSMTMSPWSLSDYVLRDGGIDDLPLIKQTVYRALAWDPARTLPPLEHTMVHPEVIRYHRDWGRPGDLAVVAMAEGAPVAAAFCRLFTEKDHGHGYVDESTPELAIAVNQGHRGRGLGAMLLAALEDRARDAGFAQISLSVDAENPARRLYVRAGYRDVFQNAEGVRMVKRL